MGQDEETGVRGVRDYNACSSACPWNDGTSWAQFFPTAFPTQFCPSRAVIKHGTTWAKFFLTVFLTQFCPCRAVIKDGTTWAQPFPTVFPTVFPTWLCQNKE